MNRFKNLAAIFAFALMVLALPSIASAQWRDRDRDDDNYRNSRYNRNIRGTLQNLKNRARNFERLTNRVEDRRDDRRDDRWGRNGTTGAAMLAVLKIWPTDSEKPLMNSPMITAMDATFATAKMRHGVCWISGIRSKMRSREPAATVNL